MKYLSLKTFLKTLLIVVGMLCSKLSFPQSKHDVKKDTTINTIQ